MGKLLFSIRDRNQRNVTLRTTNDYSPGNDCLTDESKKDEG